MKELIEKRLHALLNKQLSYGSHLLVITGYNFNDSKERVYIHTNEKDSHFDRPYDGAIEFLKQFTEMKGEVRRIDSTDMAMVNASSLATELKDILLDNIKRVQANPEYVKQATVINNNVNTLVNLTKLQMAFHKQKRD